MPGFVSVRPGGAADAMAPDGSQVRPLAALKGGSFAHFTLAAGAVSDAVRHKSVEEIWWFVSGTGALWRSLGGHERIEAVKPGDCVTIPVGAAFQFRADWDAPLVFVGVTMPPWPGADEATGLTGMWPKR